MKISAGIVLFNPEYERLKENINAIIGQVSRVVLVDNSPVPTPWIEELLENGYRHKCFIITNFQNFGIAKALNQICENARQNGEDWVLTLDQDSVCSDNMIAEYMRVLSMNEGKVGMITCAVREEKIDQQLSGGGANEYYPVERCATSGAFTKVSVWEEIGGFREELFIDYVDFDYTARLLLNEYRIILANNATLLHQLGDCTYIHLGKRKIRVSNHSAFRKYYIGRNIVIYIRRYRRKINMRLEYLRLLKVFLFIILFEKEKMKKLRSFFKGVRDGITFRLE